MPRKEKPVWFCVRENGLSYYPVSWQGYVTLIAYVLLLSASSLAIFKSWGLFFGLVGVISILLVATVSRTCGPSEF